MHDIDQSVFMGWKIQPNEISICTKLIIGEGGGGRDQCRSCHFAPVEYLITV